MKPNAVHAQGVIESRRRIKKKKHKRIRRKKGGAKVYIWRSRDDFYTSDLWRAVWYRVLVANGGRCCACGATAKDGHRMHVDHIKPRSKFPELQLEASNLQVLCEACNLGKGNMDSTDWR